MNQAGAPPGGGGTGKPPPPGPPPTAEAEPEPEETGGESPEKKSQKEAYQKAKETLDQNLKDGLIDPESYNAQLRDLAKKFAVEETEIDTEEKAKKKAQIVKEQGRTKDQIEELLGEKKKKKEPVNYRELGIDDIDELKKQMQALNEQDDDTQKQIKELISRIGIDKNDLPSDLDPDVMGLDDTTDKNFNQKFEELRAKYENANGQTRPELESELQKLKEKSSLGDRDVIRLKEIETVLLPQITKIEDDFKKLKELKHKEAKVEKEMGELMTKITRVSKTIDKKMEATALKDQIIRNGTLLTGINLQEGVKFQFEDMLIDDAGNPTTEKKKREFVIKKIHFQKRKTANRDFKRETLNHILGPEIEIEELGVTPEQLSHFAAGELQGKYTLPKFKKMVDKEDLTEVIPSVEELNKTLGWDARIEKGAELEYIVPFHDEVSGKTLKVPKTIKIEDVQGERLILDQEIVIPIDSRIESGERKYKNPTFGEFAKWYRVREATQKIPHIDGLRAKLKELNDFFNQKLNRKSEQFPPIEVIPGEALRNWNDNREKYFIKEITPNGNVVIEGDGELSPTQFYRFVRDNGLEKYDPTLEAKKKLEMLSPEDLNAEKVDQEIKKSKELLEKERDSAKEKGVTLEDKGLTFYDWNNADAVFNKFNLWHDMRLLSFYDFKEMGKTIWAFVVRRYQRRAKYNYGMIGKTLPGKIGTEFAKIQQTAETEEMEQYKSSFQAFGVWDLKSLLYDTSNRDEAKAIFNLLSEKGELRWDDQKMWKTLERITHGKFTVDGEDKCKDPIDDLWGQGQWHDWYGATMSNYNSKKKNFEYKGKQLENDPKQTGALGGEMKRLLTEWKAGKYVNPIEYEELIDYAIDFGKMTAEQKMFYLMAGAIEESPAGYGTLLHMDRFGDLDGRLLNKFPLLDYFTQPNYRDMDIDRAIAEGKALSYGDAIKKAKAGQLPEVKSRRLERKDFVYFKDKYFSQEYQENSPGVNFSKFLWEVMLTDKNTRTRLSKGLRAADAMDHDDAHMFIPPGTPEEIRTLTTSAQGNKKYFTPEAYANAYAGFSQYILSLTNKVVNEIDVDERRQTARAVTDAIRSFVCYDAIIANRYKKSEGDRYQRLGSHHFERASVVDAAESKYHRRQMRSLVKDIARAYGEPEASIQYMFDIVVQPLEDNEKGEKQHALERQIENIFEVKIPAWFEQDNGEKMIKVICQHSQIEDLDSKGEHNENSLRGLAYYYKDKKDRTIYYKPPGPE